jgi:DNA polymerase-3 subunit gamma/tau
MIENIEMNAYNNSSGCVASMAENLQPTLAQREVKIEDVLNSPMIQKAIELFQPETPLRVNNKA